MEKVLKLNARGTLTLPKAMRRRLGVGGNARVVAQEIQGGILLRPSVTFPVEIYDSRRLAEFRRHNQDALEGLRRKRKLWGRTVGGVKVTSPRMLAEELGLI